MDNKKIAKYELAFIGGNPKVYRYYNEDESKHIDILTSQKVIVIMELHVLVLD